VNHEITVLERHNIKSDYDHNAVRIAIMFSILSGVISACMGMAGGIVLVNVMLAFKINPKVLSATSTFRSINMSIVSGIQYVFLGNIDWN